MTKLLVYFPPPPSLNEARMAIVLNRGKKKAARLIDTPKLRDWKKSAADLLTIQMKGDFADIKEHAKANGTFLLTIRWHGNHWFKNGKPRTRDIDNRVKFLSDCISAALEIDDSHIFRFVLEKHTELEKTPETELFFCDKGEIVVCELEVIPIQEKSDQ